MGGVLSQELYRTGIRMVSEMIVKGEYGVEAKMVYQDKACAVGKAQPPVFKLSEDGLCSGFDVSGNPEDVDVAFLHLIHKLYGSCMAASHFEERVSLVQDIIGCVKNGFSFLKLRIDGFCLWIILVVRNGESAEGSGVYKDFQSITPPYRYLS